MGDPFCPSFLIRCRGNEVLLQQALLNLLYNAFDAVLSEDNPIIQFTTTSVENQILFTVRDNGCGVPKELQENLFKPFVSDKKRTSGLGLGLTLAEVIAKDHNGSIGYAPINGSGSEFSLVLPQSTKP